MSIESIRNLKKAAKDKKENPPKKKFYKIKPRTQKKAKEFRQLGKKVGAFLAKNEECQIKSPVCTFFAGAAHHSAGRGKKEVLDETKFVPCCYPCNGYVESHPEWAKARGVTVSRHTKRDQ